MKNSSTNSFGEINLKQLLRNIWNRKFLFLFSLTFFLGLAYLFTKLATPIYKISSSLLIDSSGKNRNLGESEYVQGGVGMIDMEKNLYNEMGILKSYGLIEEALKELNYDVSYHTGPWYNTRENYGYFPFEITLLDSTAQVYDVPFKVVLEGDDKFSLYFKSKKFEVYNPVTNTTRKVEREMEFSKIYKFGEEVQHEYFNFILDRPDYDVDRGAFEGKELSFQIHSINSLTNQYLEKLDVGQIDIQASILKLSTKGAVPEKEIRFLRKLSEKYINQCLDNRNEIASNKEKFIKAQLKGIKDSLSIAERSLASFKQGANAVNLERTAVNALDRLQVLETEKGQTELNLDYYFSLLKYIGEGSSVNKIMAPSVVGINDPLLNENLLELKKLSAERAKVKYYKGEKSYDLEMLDNQIRTTSIALQESLKNLIKASKRILKNNNKQIAKLEKSVNTLPNNEKQLVNFERKNNLYGNLYNYLSQELAKTEIARAEHSADTKILDAPRVEGTGPVFPQKILFLTLATLLGLLIPFAWMLIANMLDNSLNDISDIENITDIPVAASIAHYKANSKLLLIKPSNWQVEESFRDLTANLHFLVPNKHKNVIGITSTISGEGKSFCSINLAINLARSGKKVLLIDLDFRNPSLIQETEELQGKGFANYLKGEINDLESIIKHHKELPALHFIPTHTEDNPQELLSNIRLNSLIETIRYEYDYIIFDAPAVGLVSDYLLIQDKIDIHLYVVRKAVSQKSYLKNIEEIKEKGLLENVFLIYNDVPNTSIKYGLTYETKGQKSKSSLITQKLSIK